MPPVVAAISAAAASVSAVMATTVFGIKLGTIIAGTYIVGSAVEGRRRAKSAAAAARQAYFASLQDRSVMIRSAIAPRNLVYGYDKVSGPMVDAFTTGANGQYLHLIVALAGRAVQGIPTVYLNEFPIEAGQIDVDGNVTGAQWGKTTTHSAEHDAVVAGDGTVTLPQAASGIVMVGIGEYVEAYWNYGTVGAGWAHTPYTATITGLTPGAHVRVTYQWQTTASRLRIHKFLGDHTSIPAGLLAETDGRRTAAHVGHGVAHLWVRLEWDQEVWGQIGVPQISALVQGHRVWDPRTSTTAWSENAALCAADYARDQAMGLGCTASQVPDDELAAEANICDEAVPLDAGGTTTQARYTCRGTLSAADSRLSNLDSLLSAMAGSAMWLQGRWRIRAGAHPTPEPITLTVDHLGATPPQLRKSAPRRELFNSVTASYRDPAANYSEVAAPQFPPDGVGPYVAQDGGRRVNQQVQLTMVHDAVRAQRLAKIMLERARQAEAVTIETNARAYNLAPGQVVPVTIARYGWTNKLMEVRQRELNIATGTVRYLLRATSAEVWDWAHGEATLVDPAPDTQLPSPFTAPPAPANLALTTGNATLLRLTDGTLVARVRATWDATAAPFVASGGRIELQWRLQAAEAWTSEQPLPGDATEHTIGPLDEGLPIIVRVRSVNSAGRLSAWAWAAITVVGKDAPPSDATGLTSSVAAGVIRWAWDTCPDIDYQATEVRATDANWGSDTSPPLWRGRVSEWLETVTATGTYTRHVRHLDTGGRPSAATATRAQVVGSGDLGGDAAAQPALVLTPESVTLAADTFGAVVSWADATTAATLVLPDGTDDTVNGWTFSKADTNVISTLGGALGNVVTVTGYDPAAVAEDYANTVLQLHLDGNLKDTSRYNRTPAYQNMVGLSWADAGDFGQGLVSTGVTVPDGKVRFSGADFRSRGGPWSLRARFKLTRVPSVGETFYALGNGAKNISFTASGTHPGKATANGFWNSTLGSRSASAGPLDAGVWYDIELNFGSDGRLRVFANGVSTSHFSTPMVGAADLDGDSTAWIDIGTYFTSSGFSGVYFLGVTDEVRYIVEGGSRTADYALTGLPYPNGPYAPAAYVDVTATKGADTKTRRFSLTTVPSAPQQVVAASLSVPQVTVFADWDGSNVTLAGATSQLRCLIDGAESITQWQVTQAAVSAGVTVTVSAAGLVTVTAFPSGSDVGTVDFSLFRTGYPSQSVRLTISKSRRPQPSVTLGGPASIVVAGDTAGVVPSASLPVPAAVDASQGGLVATSLYTWAVSASAGITLSSTTTASTSITAMASGTDAGSITWTGTRTGWPTLSWRASVSKTKLLFPAGAVRSPANVALYTGASATGSLRLKVCRDGSVKTWRSDSTGWTTATNSAWHNPIVVGAGDAYEVLFLPSQVTGEVVGAFNQKVALSSDVEWTAGAENGGTAGIHGFSGSVAITLAGSSEHVSLFFVSAGVQVL